MQDICLTAMHQALSQARRFVGATSPNPPVGAAGLDAQGNLLAVEAHEKAGTGHAEARVIRTCEANGTLSRLHTVVVTLEPCNHVGRTPPCSEALLRARVRRVLYGVRDPNPKVTGRGADRLREAGVEVMSLSELSAEVPGSEAKALLEECRELIRPFAHWAATGLPWVTVKTAHRAGTADLTPESMTPPPGQKTFTSPEALRYAHELRKRADAVVTGSGTVLADLPEFTVRHVVDHPAKNRWLVVLDRRGRTPATWIESARQRGFQVRTGRELESELRFLGSQGVLEVLVEAGPSVSTHVLSGGFWNRHVVITEGIEIRERGARQE